MAADEEAVIDWLLEGDPAIRWQAMRDLLDEPSSVWEAERARTADEGWVAELLARRPAWGGGKVNATSMLLDPLTSDESAELVDNLLPAGRVAEDAKQEIRASIERYTQSSPKPHF